ncbi:hypothetical protein ABIE67_002930 [Streptomyces sp. V4I8]|uniref:hypothetical protein n=1 Tax=Streptomyces sp. V4I8 TaxID=3156469 RepID=UPI00351268F9
MVTVVGATLTVVTSVRRRHEDDALVKTAFVPGLSNPAGSARIPRWAVLVEAAQHGARIRRTSGRRRRRAGSGRSPP